MLRSRWPSRIPVVALLFAAVSACSDSTKPGAPAAVDAVSGSGVSVTVGAAIGVPLVARVLDDKGNPVPGVAVDWAVPTDDGTVNDSTTTTDNDGYASVAFIGTSVGAATVTATVGSSDVADFSVSVVAQTPSGQ